MNGRWTHIGMFVCHAFTCVGPYFVAMAFVTYNVSLVDRYYYVVGSLQSMLKNITNDMAPVSALCDCPEYSKYHYLKRVEKSRCPKETHRTLYNQAAALICAQP